jgi:hypothetical protein
MLLAAFCGRMGMPSESPRRSLLLPDKGWTPLGFSGTRYSWQGTGEAVKWIVRGQLRIDG